MPPLRLPPFVLAWLLIAAGHVAAIRTAPWEALGAFRALAVAAGLIAWVLGSRRSPGVRLGTARAHAMACFTTLSFVAVGASLGLEASRFPVPLEVHPEPLTLVADGFVSDAGGSAETAPRLRFALRRVRVGSRVVDTNAEVLLRWPSGMPPPTWATAGTALRVRGAYRPPEDRRSQGGAAFGEWLAGDGLEGTLTADPGGIEAWAPRREARALGPAPGAAMLAGLRVALADRLEACAGPEAAALARGMLLGDRAGVAPETRQSFRNAGTFHILSISGLHVCIVAAFMAAGARMLGLGAGLAMTVELAGLAGYVAFVGAPPPALRSALLWTLTRGARLLGRASSPFAGWGAAGLLLHLASPGLTHELGFLLSFGAVLGLFAGSALVAGLAPAADAPRLRRWGHAVRAGVASGAGAALGTLPVEAVVFGSVPVAGPLANLVVIPLTALFLAEAILTAGAACIVPPALAASFGGALDAVAALLTGANDLLGGRIDPFAMRRAPAIHAAALSVLALLAAAGIGHAATRAGSAGARRARGAAAACLLAALLAPFLRAPGMGPRPGRPSGGTALVALDVGQGDAAFLLAPGGEAVLVDAGPRSDRRDEGRSAVEPALRVEGVDRIALAVSSHGHRDHEGGLLWLARRGWLDRVIENGGGSDDRDGWRSALKSHGGPAVLAAGDSLSWAGGGWTIRIMGPRAGRDPAREAGDAGRPPPGANTLENDRSIVALAVAKDEAGGTEWSALFPGDVEEGGERAWLAGATLGPIDVLKVPHHGSATSSTPAWVDRLRPRLAIVSVGEGNRHRHPAAETVSRYRRAGAWVLRTDREGTIRVTSSGGRLLVSTRAHPAPIAPPARGPAPISPCFDFP